SVSARVAIGRGAGTRSTVSRPVYPTRSDSILAVVAGAPGAPPGRSGPHAVPGVGQEPQAAPVRVAPDRRDHDDHGRDEDRGTGAADRTERADEATEQVRDEAADVGRLAHGVPAGPGARIIRGAGDL